MSAGRLKVIQMFTLHRPQFLLSCACMLRRKLATGVPLTEDQLLRVLSQHNSLPVDCSILHYLELFHVIELSGTDTYHLTSDALPAATTARAHLNGSEIQFDFDGFLPVYMMNYLVCNLGLTMRAEVEFNDAQNALLSCPREFTQILIQLDPHKCLASISVTG